MAILIKNACLSSESVYLDNESFQAIQTAQIQTQVQSKPEREDLTRQDLENLQAHYYQQGFDCGLAAGKVQAEKEFATLKQQLEALLAVIPQTIAQHRLELTAEIGEIIMSIICQFFIEKAQDSQALTLQINHLLTQINSRQTVALHLHPKDIKSLQNHHIKLQASHLNSLKIISDETLAYGGFVIKTEHGVFEANIEKQIESLKTHLLAIRQRGIHAS